MAVPSKISERRRPGEPECSFRARRGSSQPHRSPLSVMSFCSSRMQMTGCGVLGRIRCCSRCESANIPCEFDGRDLHAQTKAQIGCSRFAGITRCLDLAFNTAIAKSTGNEHSCHPAQVLVRALLLEVLRVDEDQVCRASWAAAAWVKIHQCFCRRLATQCICRRLRCGRFFWVDYASTNLRQSLMSGSLVRRFNALQTYSSSPSACKLRGAS